jgi:SAM-dependent methyltransferase
MKNIKYKTLQLLKYYSSNRCTWEEFYLSERYIINKVIKKAKKNPSILDVGCGAGGLGYALSDEFDITKYTGIDINTPMIEYAKRKSNIFGVNFKFINGDIAEKNTRLNRNTYDIVTSLSCVDWNLNLEDSINACWEKVAHGGYLVSSLRITLEKGVNDIDKSYQIINFEKSVNLNDKEKANYVIINYFDALKILKSLNPECIDVYGYWGKPSDTVVTLYDKVLFSVFALKKNIYSKITNPTLGLNLPANAMSIINQ